MAKLAKGKLVPLIEFAGSRAMSPNYIRKLVRDGKITSRSVARKGKRISIYVDSAIRDMEHNISHINKRPVVPEPGKPPGDQVDKAFEAVLSKRPQDIAPYPDYDAAFKPGSNVVKSKVSDPLTQRPPAGMIRSGEISSSEILETIQNGDVMTLTLAEAQTVHERYKAALKKLDFEKKQGELLPAAEVKQIWTESISAARSKILSLKGKLGPLLREFMEDQNNFNILMAEIEAVQTEVLKDLARGGI